MKKLLQSLLLIVPLASCATGPGPAAYRAEILRTAGGIPHIYADDWGSLGFATLYAMAEDNVCILARQNLKFSASLSRYFPGDAAALSSDFFYQLMIDRKLGGGAADPRLQELFAGAAAGYNHYLDSAGDTISDPDCRGTEWLIPATALNFKRISAADYALDYMHPMIVAARPPAGGDIAPHSPESLSDLAIARAVDIYLGRPKQGGSNAIAVGAEETLGAKSLLLANPHMPWNEPLQRFYPMQQVIAGEINMLGATLLGRPRVGFGTGEHLAWTSTVSTARRAIFYRLQLVPGQPTRYRFDGEEYEMNRETVSVGQQQHHFYSTHFGALLVQSPFFSWNAEQAFAVLMPEVGLRGENAAFEQYQATSVRELKAVHNRYQFLTVNLIAADDSGEVMYTDPGPIPNLDDEQMQSCALLHGAALDGSRSDCLWQTDSDAAAPGIIGPALLPVIFRKDYVTNSNDSYWLANPEQPLRGFAGIIGSEGSERTLRTRSGLQMVQREIARQGGISQQALQRLTLANENFAGQILRDDLVDLCRNSERPQLTEACEVLAAWDLHDNNDSRGAHLLRQTLYAANKGEYQRRLPAHYTPAIAFDPAAPVDTPAGLVREDAQAVLDNLAAAVKQLRQAGIPLDARLGDIQHVTRNGRRIPIHGGPEIAGVFNKLEADFQGSAGYPEVTRWSSSWIMATAFTASGPRSLGILAYSLSANPNSPHYRDQTELFSSKRWLELPFKRGDVEAQAVRSYRVSGARCCATR